MAFDDVAEAAAEYTCSVCLPGFFDVDGRGLACTACPTGVTCPGGSTVVVQRGYWGIIRPPDSRPASLANVSSLFVMPCEFNRDSCCPTGHCEIGAGVVDGQTTACQDGFMGITCYQCGAGKGQWNNQCWDCDRYAHGWIAALFVVVAFVAVIAIALVALFVPQNSERVSFETMLFHYEIGARMLQLNAFWSGAAVRTPENEFLGTLIQARNLDDTLLLLPVASCRIVGDLQRQLAILLMPGFYLFMPAVLIVVAGVPWLRAKKFRFDWAQRSSNDFSAGDDLVHPDR